MRTVPIHLALFASVLYGFLGTAHAASLLTLQNGAAVAVIQDGPGIQPAPVAGQAEPFWWVRPGTSRYQNQAPADRRVDLLHAVNGHL
ncbi:MAG TPA: hypothetical protein VFN52_06360, partial [Acidiferrobacteraceae bacterium]|nr:hypothetical protein [Acidiferrobacteraceae bacterium]